MKVVREHFSVMPETSLQTVTGRTLRSSTHLKRKSLEAVNFTSDIYRGKKRSKKELSVIEKNVVDPECSILLDDKREEKVSLHVKTKPNYLPITNHVQQLPEDSVHQFVQPCNYVLTCDLEFLRKIPENFSFVIPSLKDINPTTKTTFVSDVNWKEREMLLADVLKPQNASDFVGNELVAEKLSMWLQEHKVQKELLKPVSNRRTLDYDLDFECSSDSNNSSVNAVFLFGPTGVGKTSLIYTLAQQLGFTVLELNASSVRSGRIITTKLREATLSHHVEGTTCSQDDGMTSLETLKCKSKKAERAMDSKCKGISAFFKKTSALESASEAVKEEMLPKTSLLNYFTPLERSKLIVCTRDKKSEKVIQQNKRGFCDSANVCNSQEQSQVKGLTFSSNTIILIDDVDVVFDQDEGFWSAINTFIRTTKKPVIMTASRNLREILSNVDDDVELFRMFRLIGPLVTESINRRCVEAGFHLEPYLLDELFDFCSGDVRRIFSQLQLYLCLPRSNTRMIESIEKSPLCDACLDVEHCPLVVYDQLAAIMPFPPGDALSSASAEQILNKKWSLDASWLSDDAQQLEKEPITDEAASAGSHVKKSLHHIAEHFEMFSVTDTICGCLSEGEKGHRWRIGLPSVPDCEETANENALISWMGVLSSRITSRYLQTLVSNHFADKKLSWCTVSPRDVHPDKLHHSYKEVIRLAAATCQHLNGAAVRTDYCSSLRAMYRAENVRRGSNTKRRGRFLHYFDSVGLAVNEDLISVQYFSQS